MIKDISIDVTIWFSLCSFLVKKMKYVFEQVMVMDNAKRKLDQHRIFKTMKVNNDISVDQSFICHLLFIRQLSFFSSLS